MLPLLCALPKHLAGRARLRAIALLAFAFAAGLRSGVACGQALTVMPVHVQIQPGQRATTLNVTNAGSSETSIQIRAYRWAQPGGNDQLTATDAIVASPPIATIAPGRTQVIRLLLRQAPEASEDTYRLLLDQIPPPAEQGTVHVVLRVSIPVFAQPKTRAVSHLQFHFERDAQQTFLVAANDGVVHEALHGLELKTVDGHKVETDFSGPQYVLAGVTRRWLINPKDSPQLSDVGLRLTTSTPSGTFEQQVHGVSTE